MAGTAEPCIEYGGTKNKRGYGVVPPKQAKYGTRLAHRIALADSLGRAVEGQARHSCDNPPCVNPAHLSEGTNSDNVADMVSRGRQAWGERKTNQAKLTVAEVVRMREMAAAGIKQRDLAYEFGVVISSVSMITRGISWQHAPGPLISRSPRGRH